MKKIGLIAGAIVLLAPFVALAQGGVTDLASLLNLVKSFINALVPFIIALAVLVFLWGVFRYVAAGDDEEKRKQGRQLMLNGIIAIFVMVSVWGLVNVLVNTFGLNTTPIEGPGTTPLPPIGPQAGQ